MMMMADDDADVAAWLRSHGLRIASLEGKGRAVVAAQAFRPGELMCLCSPYAYAPSGVICNQCGSTPFSRPAREDGMVVDDVMAPPQPGGGGGGGGGMRMGNRLEICRESTWLVWLDCPGIRSPDKFKVCGGCRYIRYCGLDCQKKDWPRHKTECSTLSKLYRLRKRSPTTTMMLIMRLVLRIREEKAGAGCLPQVRGSLLIDQLVEVFKVRVVCFFFWGGGVYWQIIIMVIAERLPL